MLFVIVIVPLIVGIGVALFFMFLLERQYPRGIAAMLPLLFVWAVFGSVALVYGPGAGIFGRALSCLPAIAGAIALLILTIEGFRSLGASIGDPRLRRWHRFGVFLVPLLLASPVLGEFAITRIYDTANRAAAGTIITAMAAYEDDHGDYPESLDVLVPHYLQEIPAARGFGPFTWFHEDDYIYHSTFDLAECNGVTLVTIYSLKLDFIQRYNMTTGVWSRVSFLDGVCSYVR
jgi:hypothetical protein